MGDLGKKKKKVRRIAILESLVEDLNERVKSIETMLTEEGSLTELFVIDAPDKDPDAN